MLYSEWCGKGEGNPLHYMATQIILKPLSINLRVKG